MVAEVINDVYSAVQKAGIDIVLQLPCDRIAPLLNVMVERFTNIPLTREEEGVGIAAGAALTGKKPIMVVQSSGLGNMVNAIMSLTKYYQLPLPIFVSQRGIYKENVSAQIPMGTALPKILDAMDVEHVSYNELSDLQNIQVELENTFKENKTKCFLISPKIFEGLPKTPMPPKMDNNIPRQQNKEPGTDIHEEKELIEDMDPTLTRYEALGELKDILHNKAVICNMGFPSRELYSVFDQESNFYMLGSLGLASSIGLGISLFNKKDVIVIDGDGSLLMNPNALITVGAMQPRNLTIICLDNGVFGSTGNQPTWSAHGLKLERMARGVGINNILVTSTPSKISNFNRPGPNFIRLGIKPGNTNVPTIELNALAIKERFSAWLRR